MSSPAFPGPTFITLPDDLGAHPGRSVDLWYCASALRAGDDEFAVLVILAGGSTAQGDNLMCHVVVASRNRGTLLNVHEVLEPGDFSVAADHLDVRTPHVSLAGELSAFDLTVGYPEVEAALHLAGPQVLYNCGTAYWPWHGIGPTWEFSVPNVVARGRLQLEGQAIEVEGGSWFDRQWFDLPDPAPVYKMQWMGLCLDNGHGLSIWDTSMAEVGSTWVTCLRDDGTHVVAAAPSFAGSALGPSSPATWRLTIPALDAELDVTDFPFAQLSSSGKHTGLLSIEGTYEGKPVTGYGFTDGAPDEVV